MAASAPLLAMTGETLPFALAQNEVWLDQAAWPGSAHLNIGGGGFLDGPLDRDCVKASLTVLVAENEALRLAPLPGGGQRLLEHYEADLAQIDFSGETDPVAAMRAWWKAEMARPFEFDGRPPWRFALLRGGAELHCLTIRFHHLIMDGWGTMLVIQRWSELYNALARGEAPPSADARPYRDAIAESTAYRASPAYAEDAAYWRAQLPTLPPPLFERRFAASERSDGPPPAQVRIHPLARAEYERINAAATALGQSAFTLLLAGLAIYLARVCGRGDIVIGVPTLNRGGKRYKNTLGMFTGVMPLALTVDPAMPVAAVVAQAGAALRAAMRHSRYPVSELGRQLQVIRQGRDGVFDVLFSFERQDYTLNFGSAQSREPCQHFSGLARYPLGVTLCEFHADEDLELILEASAACFAPEHADLLGPRLSRTVAAMLEDSQQAAGSLDILPREERWALLEGMHQELAGVAAPQPFIALFEHQAAMHPQATALVWDGGSFDYAGLAARVHALAGRLADAGAGPEVVVACAIERSPALVVALLAIARAGAAFLPLDVDTPTERLRDIVAESGTSLMLVSASEQARFADFGVSLFAADADYPAPAALPPLPQPGYLAYVLYTSGSTGRPKGVMIENAALARRLAWLSRAYAVTRGDRSALATQIAFDPSLIELCLPLIHGASVAIPPPGRLPPETLPDFAARHRVTLMAFVPSTLRRFCEGAEGRTDLALRVACSGGEVLAPELARRFIRQTGARLYNVYGPTETAIFATAWLCTAEPGEQALPVGRPLDDTRVYVLDTQGRPLPFYASGEIHLGGVVARGYLNRPDLDAEAFVADPFVAGGRLYRTGDIGWLAADGSLHFVGRRDRQIKLRGYRIELGEIEAQLRAIDGVLQAAVKLVEADGRAELQAWVAMPGGGSAEAVQTSLRRRLPDYMLPALITVLPALPESAVGKIDYARLKAERRVPCATASRAPSGRLECELLAIWEEALHRRPLQVCDNFFELGGDSLAAVEILAGVARLTGRRIPLYQLTENPTVEALALLLASEDGDASLIQPLGEQGGGPPLYLAASGYGDYDRFRRLADGLGPQVALHMLQPPGHGEFSTVGELAALYAERIAARPDAGGYIAGFSVAGLFALETCRQLRQRGIAVRGLILVDTLYPGTFFRAGRLWRVCAWLVAVFRLHNLRVNGRRLGSLFSDPGLLAQVRAIADYRPAPLPVPVVLIKSKGMLFWQGWAFRGWRRLFGGGLREMVVSGMHGSMFEPARVGEVAAALRAACAGDEGKGQG